MTEAMAVKPVKQRGWLWGGGGLVLGFIIGVVLASPRSGAQTGTVTTTTETASASPEVPATPASPAESPFKVNLGRGHTTFGNVMFPVTVDNGSGGDASYMEASCSFYDSSGQLVAHGLENWMNVKAGERASGEMIVQGASMKQIDKYECRGSGS